MTHKADANSRIVAVIDNDQSMLTSIGRLLSARGITSELYISAESFIAATAASAADCLLVDINLDGISGIELRRKLTASGSSIPTIFMTAVDDEEIRQTAIEAGCIAFLRKPFAARLLIDAIDKAAR